MSTALDAVPGGVVSLSTDLRILAANHSMGELVARPHEELLGQAFDVLLSAPSRILFQTHVYPALVADGRVEEVFLTLDTGGDEPTPVLLNAVRVEGAGEEAFRGLLVRILARSRWESELLTAARSIEHERAASQKIAEELAAAASDLAARYAEEQRTRRFRDAFIGVVSHELRTPITTIYGMSHVLRQHHASMDPTTVRERLEDIEAESERLRRLTEDLLVLSRAEAGQLMLASDPILMGQVVRGAVDSERLRSPGHEFQVDAPRDLPLVLGEDLYVEQVMRNFLSNAAKYSPAGTTIAISAVEDDGGVAVRVTDAGPGLRDQEPDRLFDIFYRAPEAIRHTGGAGIGLFVCRELIQAMGGRVWARNAVEAGLGAEFGFWLPAVAEEDVDTDAGDDADIEVADAT
jgi:K+-sensing histidine kinase KdpD